jgi:hypothetical protein
MTPLPTTLSAPALEHVLDLNVSIGSPVEAGAVQGLNSQGQRRVIPITGGTVSGPYFSGQVLPGGADFQIVVSDTCADLDARYLLAVTLPDGTAARVFVQNRALRRASASDTARLLRGERVDPAGVYFRCVPTFEVSHPALAWLTESVFVGTGTRAPDGVQLSFYRVM